MTEQGAIGQRTGCGWGQPRSAPDFITTLGRLLRDGNLRDAFAANAAATADFLGLSDAERSAFLSLKPDDLEFQARVLLRKRFEAVQRLLPLTCASLGE